jgi:hypothetical protein
MILPQLDGKHGHTDTGAEITLSAAILDPLYSDDLEILGVEILDVLDIAAGAYLVALDMAHLEADGFIEAGEI